MEKNISDLLKTLFQEKQKWEMASLIGKDFDFSKIREAAGLLNDIAPETFPFAIDENDAKFMVSVCETMKKYRP